MKYGSNSGNAGSPPRGLITIPGPAAPNPAVSQLCSPLPEHLLQQGSTSRNKLHSALPHSPTPSGLPMNQQGSRNKSMPGSAPKDHSWLGYHQQGNQCWQIHTGLLPPCCQWGISAEPGKHRNLGKAASYSLETYPSVSYSPLSSTASK